MKQLNNRITIISLCFAMLCVSLMYSQNKVSNNPPFVRVYNIEGKKIAKGKIVFLSDSTLGLKKSNKLKEVPVKQIGKIKTKHSGGHNVLMGSLFGASFGAILGVSTADPDALLGYTAGEGALALGALGAVGGAAIGGMTAGFKESETFIINGDYKKIESIIDLIKEH
ncbi:hypothetical protein [uncultured Algibacter sp.]|uniref:hypothetical protein n=1 Tax=uncultured Algibacter sp. TaxID=298659 RepID=UPI0026226926|nr:hypothetical protein [uncultured Algibacter sp.]